MTEHACPNCGQPAAAIPAATAEASPAELLRQVRTVTYRSRHAYEEGMRRMVAAGWSPEVSHAGHAGVRAGRTVGKAVVFLPWAVLRPSRRPSPATVTYTRDLPASTGSEPETWRGLKARTVRLVFAGMMTLAAVSWATDHGPSSSPPVSPAAVTTTTS